MAKSNVKSISSSSRRQIQTTYWNKKAGVLNKGDELTSEARKLQNEYRRKRRLLNLERERENAKRRYWESKAIIEKYKNRIYTDEQETEK